MARHVDVVVRDEHEPAREPGFPAAFDEFAYEGLAAFVVRVGLAREDDLDRGAWPIDDAGQPIEVGEDQRGAFVAGEATGEADRQRARVEHRLRAEPASHEVDQPAAQVDVRFPQLGRRDLIDVTPAVITNGSSASGCARPTAMKR